MSIQNGYKLIGGFAIAVGTVILITASVTIGQYSNYCKNHNNEKSIEDKYHNCAYVCIGIGGIILACGLAMFFGEKTRFISSVFTVKAILILGVLLGLITVVTGLIQYSFIKKIVCDDEDSLGTIKNANAGCWVTGIILLICMGIFYVSFEDEFGSGQDSEDEERVPSKAPSKSSKQAPKLSERELEQRELENVNKRLDRALSSGEDPDEILELKAERAKLLTSIERRRSSLKRQVEELEKERESSRPRPSVKILDERAPSRPFPKISDLDSESKYSEEPRPALKYPRETSKSTLEDSLNQGKITPSGTMPLFNLKFNPRRNKKF